MDHPDDPYAPVYPDARHRGYCAALAEAGLESRPTSISIAEAKLPDDLGAAVE